MFVHLHAQPLTDLTFNRLSLQREEKYIHSLYSLFCQLPEPIMPFRIYNALMGLAKESLNSESPDGREGAKGPVLEDLGPQSDPKVITLVEKLRELLKDLAPANTATLKYIIRHLRR